MTKHRLELFSDGVFAIILTLLVLDLRVPPVHQLAAFGAVGAPLAVHAASFFLVGALWYTHHGFLAPLTEVHEGTYKFNLLSLFWPTLIPFAAKNAAERPLEPLGPCLLAACTGLYVLSMFAMRLTARSTFDLTPERRRYRNRMFAVFTVMIVANLIAAAVALVTPWPAYGAAMLTAVIFMFVVHHPAELERSYPQADLDRAA